MIIQKSIVSIILLLLYFLVSCSNDLEGHRERIFECDGIVVNLQSTEDNSIDCDRSNSNGVVTSFKILGEVGNASCVGNDTYLVQTLYFYDSEGSLLNESANVLTSEAYAIIGNRVASDVCIHFDKASYVELTLYLTPQPLLIDTDISLSKVRINRLYKI
jgi:hypothetical protein